MNVIVVAPTVKVRRNRRDSRLANRPPTSPPQAAPAAMSPTGAQSIIPGATMANTTPAIRQDHQVLDRVELLEVKPREHSEPPD
ncbi:hypothetical protein LVY72_14270 [Arthrobacter sp. I2-34]|uniref:Uncharacterized protein n=1 Tax=Arthrobacter hankyongi TaxID=2904801 RepID=A0ABS9L8S0_9MICC|nr:hypothetical protein [Arthrobacter hankyongi]MCG2623065.1 hypothetical protein [Arthrobacter hankyongi]